ncbi:MAG TPA: AMP-binding protein [Kofleriaceae bacterium]|nr:AMP-binding protein [Kofleriaceae bacterium]
MLARLAAEGVHAGDRMAVIAGNGPAFVAARDAATAAELTLVPINPRLAPAEIDWIVAHAKPRVILREELIEAQPATIDHEAIGATLLYTSGTTGRPKGCVRSAAQERARATELRGSYAISRADTHLIVCPLAHSAPGIFLRACRAAGARTAIAARFDPHAFVDDVVRHRATIVFLVPTQVYRLLALPRPALPSLRAVIVAGAPFPPAQKQAFEAWLGPDRLYEFYGSSETGTISVIGPRDHAAHPGSVGRAPPGVDVRVIDGEIFARSPAVMSGYLRDDDTLEPRAEDGFLSVGDLGSIDDGGWITLVDRKHDTIITGGRNVYPAEVERAIATLGLSAVVFGVADDEWGQIVAAVIGGPPRDLRDALRDQLAGYKLPRAIAWCAPDELPIGSSGKALRRAARAAFANRLTPVDARRR